MQLDVMHIKCVLLVTIMQISPTSLRAFLNVSMKLLRMCFSFNADNRSKIITDRVAYQSREITYLVASICPPDCLSPLSRLNCLRARRDRHMLRFARFAVNNKKPTGLSNGIGFRYISFLLSHGLLKSILSNTKLLFVLLCLCKYRVLTFMQFSQTSPGISQ